MWDILDNQCWGSKRWKTNTRTKSPLIKVWSRKTQSFTSRKPHIKILLWGNLGRNFLQGKKRWKSNMSVFFQRDDWAISRQIDIRLLRKLAAIIFSLFVRIWCWSKFPQGKNRWKTNKNRKIRCHLHPYDRWKISIEQPNGKLFSAVICSVISGKSRAGER